MSTSSSLNIEKPTLVINKKRIIANISRMEEKSWKSDVRFRPHFKTHQSATIGEWFRDFGIRTITVSSVDMAKYFAGYRWNDIMIAFPINVRQIDGINELAKAISLHLLVEEFEVAKNLDKLLYYPVQIWIKIDVGYNRTGIDYTDTEAVIRAAETIKGSKRMTLNGILTHAGHSYNLRSRDSVTQLYAEQVNRMNFVKSRLVNAGFSPIEISIGDTPCCSVVERFDGIDEVRPGNFVFYDATQLAIGSCTEDDIALACACPVVAKHKSRLEIILYGGAVHLSKDVLIDSNGTKVYGRIAVPVDNGWGKILQDLYVSALSQEHGIVKTDAETFGRISVGDIMYVIPVHSCLTADLHRRYITTEGDIVESGKY